MIVRFQHIVEEKGKRVMKTILFKTDYIRFTPQLADKIREYLADNIDEEYRRMTNCVLKENWTNQFLEWAEYSTDYLLRNGEYTLLVRKDDKLTIVDFRKEE